MKKLQTMKRLSLARETLRQLENTKLGEAQGGATVTTCTGTDNTCLQTSCGPRTCFC